MLLQLLLAILAYEHLLVLLLVRTRLLVEAQLVGGPPMLVCHVGVRHLLQAEIRQDSGTAGWEVMLMGPPVHPEQLTP